MAQLYYRYSTMNAGKSLEIIKVANNYEELGKRVMCLVPEVDDRYERDMVTSRVGLSHKAYTVDDDTNIMTLFIEKNMRHQIDCVLVDECQFFRKHHVQELAEIVDSFDVPVLAYGLKNDFKNELFEGSYYFLVYADKIEEIKTICWCGRKATMVARIQDGKIIKQGDQIAIGGNDMYASLCHQCEGRNGAAGKGIHLIEKNPNPSEQYENYRLLRSLYPSNSDGFPVPLVPHRRGKEEGIRAGQAGGRHPLSGGAGPSFP